MSIQPHTSNDSALAALNTSPAGSALSTSLSGANDVAAGLAEWATALDSAYKLGSALCSTEFVPQNFRNKPEAAAAAILSGYSLGLSPMNALSNIFVVQGRPAMYARTMQALVQAQGHEVEREAATDDSVTVIARRKGSTRWQEFTWTIERAKKAGYTSNKKYQSDPIAMLTAKAIAEACRIVAPDVLAGMPYSAEEMELEDLGEQGAPATGGRSLKPAGGTRKITRKPKTQAGPAPEAAPAEPAPDQVDESTGEVSEGGPAVLETDWAAEIKAVEGNRDALAALWNRATSEGAPAEVIEQITVAGANAA